MSKFLKFVCFFVCTTSLLFLVSCGNNDNKKSNLLDKIKKRGYIIAGVKFDSKPFGYIDSDQELKGFDIELIQEITKRILGDKNKVEFRQVTSSTRIPELTSGNIDLVAATMTKNESRAKVIDFSEVYFIAGQTLLVPINSSIENVNDLSGKTVLVVLGSTNEKNIREIVPDAKILGFRTYTDAFSALKAKRGDALTTDDSIIAGMIADDSSNFKMLSERFTEEPYAMGFKKGEDVRSFRETVNKIVKDMKEDGSLETIRKKWMEDLIKPNPKLKN